MEFLLDGLATPEGGFASALDADTDGVEGATYAWTPAQLDDALGDEDGPWVADLLGVTAAGTFEHGTSVLRLARDIDGAPRCRQPAGRRCGPGCARSATRGRSRPGTTRSWPSGTVSRSPRSPSTPPSPKRSVVTKRSAPPPGVAAVAAGLLLAGTHVVDGRLRRVSRDGVVGEPDGVLADYGCVATAFATLHQLTGATEWLRDAGVLLDRALELFPDGTGGFFDTASDAETLIMRPADPTDGATPSGNSAIIEALTIYTALTGETRYREAADAALGTVVPLISGFARFAGLAAAVGEAMHRGADGDRDRRRDAGRSGRRWSGSPAGTRRPAA